ncbi:MAG TPA: hypothetical protein PKA10_09205 [Selenomonadales bacterium]|nr:hypothetical protein [Selenomonadales bacterium]
MADLKQNMFRHLRSAKQWLAKAEESFDKDSDIRGELDLFLAQAELQHARETSRSRPVWYRQQYLRQLLSFAVAVIIGISGFGGYWMISRNAAMPIPLAAQEAKPNNPAVQTAEREASVIPAEVEKSQPASPAAASTVSVQPAETPAPQRVQASRPIQAAKENIVSPDEMQRMVQAAGKSLRGQ